MSSEAQEYGNKEIEMLSTFYGEDKNGHPPLMDSVAMSEWQTVKKTVIEQMYPRDNIFVLWGLIKTFHGDVLPESHDNCQVGND